MTRVAILFLALLLGSPIQAAGPAKPAGKPDSIKPDAARADTAKPADAKAALLVVLDVERQSKAYYAAVLNKHRPIHPFGMVYRMERLHEQAVESALKRLSVSVPEAASDGEAIKVPADKAAATAKAVEMEKKTVAAYDVAIKATKNAELRTTLKRLRAESVDHRKWFEDPESCPMGSGRGRGAGPGRGGAARGGPRR